MNSEKPICQICESKPASYTCPKCDCRYCSLECYKSPKHGNCSESFYKKEVHDFMKAEGKVSDEEKKEMMELLQEYHKVLDEDQNDVIDQDDIFERFGNMDLESASADQIWEKLSWKERQEFESIIGLRSSKKEIGSVDSNASDEEDQLGELDIEKLAPVWKPWWLKSAIQDKAKSKVSKIETLDEARDNIDNDDGEYDDDVPAIERSAIKPLSQILKKPPHPSVLNQMLLVILAYTYTARHVNGDLFQDADLSMNLITDIAQFLTLKTAPIYSSADEIFVIGFNQISDYEQKYLTIEARSLLLNDVARICSDPRSVLSSLSDLYRLFDSKPNNNNNSISKKKTFLAKNRLKFLLSVADYFTPQSQQQTDVDAGKQDKGTETLDVRDSPSTATTSTMAIWGSIVSQVETIKAHLVLEVKAQRSAESGVKRLETGSKESSEINNEKKQPLIQKIDKDSKN